MTRQFAQITFKLSSALHIGSGRSGMLAKCHGFVPGHILTYALAAAIGKANGGQYEDFTQALDEVKNRISCGPLFIENPQQAGSVLFPRRDRTSIERQFLTASNHVTLMPDSRASVEGALFEVERISAQIVRGTYRRQVTRLIGGLWHTDSHLAGKPLSDWLSVCLLGGETKSGCGLVILDEWSENASTYAGLEKSTVDGQGLSLTAGERLPGPALSGVGQAPQQPWLGRLYDKQQGFGRRLSEAALIYMDGICEQDAIFLPHASELGLGCWATV